MRSKEHAPVRLASWLRNGLSRLRPRKNRPYRRPPALAENEEREVEILERRELTLPTVDGSKNSEIWITYRFGTLPPGLLRINSKDLTEEKEKAALKADIQRRISAQPKKVKV